MTLPTDFLSALPKLSVASEDGPVYYLWVYDPDSDDVILEHNEDKHHADHVDHADLGRRVPHPERVHGYAYRIKGGWRITTEDHKPIKDPHVIYEVVRKLKREKHEPKPSQQQHRARR